MTNPTSWSGLITVALALVCFFTANAFQSHSRRHDSPQAWWAFYAAASVFVFAVIIAVRQRNWLGWLAAALVAVIALAIPLLLIWVV